MPEYRADRALIDGLIDIGIAEGLAGNGRPSMPAMPATEEGLEAEFFLAAYRYARSWLIERGGRPRRSAPCAFVRVRAVNSELQRLGMAPISYFRSRPDQDVRGGIYVASGDLGVVARTDTTRRHADVDALAAAIAGHGLDDCTCVIFRADRAELILCRSRLIGASSTASVAIELGAPVRLSPEELERRIWRFHSRFTQLPGGCMVPWIGAAMDRVPSHDLERRISLTLCAILNTELQTDLASAEHNADGGRLDIRVAKEAMEPGHGHCVLELKVLRSREPSGTGRHGYNPVSPNEMTTHALDGVEQAHDYRVRLSAGSAYLCCFDARMADEEQPEVVAAAAGLDVRLRRYFMYASPTLCRKAKAAARRAGRLLPGEVD